MSEIVLVSRVPWPFVETVKAAFEEARNDRSRSPLRPFFRSSALDGVEIVRKKKYRIFGAVETTFAQASTFLTAAIEQKSIASIDVGDAPTRSEGDALKAMFSHDHGLPKWMHGDKGPSLVSPEERLMLVAILGQIDIGWTEAEKQPLVAHLAQCAPTDGLMIEL